jgi:hypothetical protein
MVEGLVRVDLGGADSLGGGLAAHLSDGLEVDAILTNLLGAGQFGRAVAVFTELTEAGIVGLFGARANREELEVIGEGFRDCVRGGLFICMASI